MFNDTLLRSVRDEIQEHLHFTEKETDIYKIFQSGDLANLDGLDDASLSRLPSVLKLRDAMYSARFREYLAAVTGSGKLSGRKTDMAINVYNEGCHLLCHDDVIGSRRLSYILYLTDPDTPWQAEWGGALRLYPTSSEKDMHGEEVKIPSPDYSLSIPPSFNQLSFFTVQPGESFHDVEEVYHPEDKTAPKRVRMAISGWFHIPQEGEDGFEPGLEQKLAERSSLAQLQGRGDIYDLPQAQTVVYDQPDAEMEVEDKKGKGKAVEEEKKPKGAEFTESDLSFLVQYIAPSYLTPDIAEEMSESFGNESTLSLERFLCEKFATRVRAYIEEQEKRGLPSSAEDIHKQTGWTVARPPHKHRYVFLQPSAAAAAAAGESTTEKTPIDELLNDLFPSEAFRKWLAHVTGSDRLTSHNLLARRFRRGQDYTLASDYDGDEPRLEFTLGLTPTTGWEKDENENSNNSNGKPAGDAKEDEDLAVGGYELYMAGDGDDDGDQAGAQNGDDPAIYRSAGADEDDGILLTTAAGWNRLSIVYRDRGTLRFVKYVSAAARGDRWDITGEMGAEYDDDDDEDGEDDQDEGDQEVEDEEDGEEEEDDEE